MTTNDWKKSYFELMERSIDKIEVLERELQQIKQAIKDNCCVELNGELMAQDWAAGFIELNRHKRGGV
jgi:uncharacterized protein (UPF0335 family)